MAMKVGINGFGRIGRNVLRYALENNVNEIEIVAINNPGKVEDLAHLFKYDSCFGRFDGTVEVNGEYMIVNGKKIRI